MGRIYQKKYGTLNLIDIKQFLDFRQKFWVSRPATFQMLCQYGNISIFYDENYHLSFIIAQMYHILSLLLKNTIIGQKLKKKSKMYLRSIKSKITKNHSGIW